MAGRKPTGLKVLEGTFRKDRDSESLIIEPGSVDCPVWLPKSAQKYWKRLAPELERVGLISVVDGAAFMAHCDSIGRFEDVSARLGEIEDMLDETPQGYIMQSALFQIRNKLWDQVVKSAREFGITPASRSAIKLPNVSKKKNSGWDDL